MRELTKKQQYQKEYDQRTKHAAQKKYNANHTTSISIRLMNATENDILSHLNQQRNKAGYIKSLIKEDMKGCKKMNKNEIRATIKLYQALNLPEENIANDYEHGYLSVNKARNGRYYIWYADEHRSAVCDIDTLEIIDSAEFIDEEFC